MYNTVSLFSLHTRIFFLYFTNRPAPKWTIAVFIRVTPVYTILSFKHTHALHIYVCLNT